ncbi:MAG: hypothetical protein HQ594_01935 [Candidatus Omnitrophica bacterium]|nr:hypothetical protein [Candidatus Omnitrophota bacterium]
MELKNTIKDLVKMQEDMGRNSAEVELFDDKEINKIITALSVAVDELIDERKIKE